jgi:hypothetical protein
MVPMSTAERKQELIRNMRGRTTVRRSVDPDQPYPTLTVSEPRQTFPPRPFDGQQRRSLLLRKEDAQRYRSHREARSSQMKRPRLGRFAYLKSRNSAGAVG